MRAAILREYGQVPEIGEFPDPEPAEGQAVVEVVAAGLNPVDISIASGSFYQAAAPLPYVVGREGVGRTADGEVVYFDSPVPPYGSFAERTLVESGSLIPLPVEIDPALATCFGIAGVAAWVPLERRAELREGETVLVLGASGVLGGIAVQAARLLGAGRVVAAARSQDGLERARARGADAAVQFGATDNLVEALREACAGGPDVVIDPLWGEPAAAAIQACAPKARFIQIGQSAGAHSSIASAAVRGKALSILGHANVHVPFEVKRAAYTKMVEHAAAGRLIVDIERVPLENIADAWNRQRSSPGHKLVIVP
jgi:NADPH:quinone reductase-like Zn-dependent oxidoreductase